MPAMKDELRFAMKPRRWTLFWRSFWPYQLLRFAIINWRMLRMIGKSH